MPQQWQGARAIVGQFECQGVPADFRAGDVGNAARVPFAEQRPVLRQSDDVVGLEWMETPGIIRPMPERDDQQTVGCQQFTDDAHGALMLAGFQMHPNGADQYQLKALVQRAQAFEFRQAIIQPGD